MKNQCKNVTIIEEAIHTIDEYYDYSFRIQNNRCYPLLSKLIQQIEDVFSCIHVKQQEEIQAALVNIVEAMSNNDYVKIRDLLYYDLKMLLQKV